MVRSITSSLYKLFKDRPFRVTLIIGLSLAVMFTMIYHGTDIGATGSYMLESSSSPTNNFGVAVPINLVAFIVGEYNYGTIRNKIISGNRRVNIYVSLFITGIIFSFILMFAYCGLSVGLGSMLDGWGDLTDGGEIASLILISALTYVMLSAVALFFASLFKHQGLAITCTTLLIFSGLITAIIYFSMNGSGSITHIDYWLFGINPLAYHALSTMTFSIFRVDASESLLPCVVSCLGYTALFLGMGILKKKKNDIK